MSKPDTDTNSDTETQTTSVPTNAFARMVLNHAREGEFEWNVTDEVREKIDYGDVLDPSNVVYVEADGHSLRVHTEVTSSVSEQTHRATRWEPASYEHHDVPVHTVVEWEWGKDERLTIPFTRVEQTDDPMAPPEPNIEKYRHDL